MTEQEKLEKQLFDSVIRGDKESVKTYIDNGLDINAQNNYGNTALIIAAEFCEFDIAELLIEHGADVNIKNNDGKTALEVAEYELKINKQITQKTANNIYTLENCQKIKDLLKETKNNEESQITHKRR